jgi:AraC-like DNA-binding protein
MKEITTDWNSDEFKAYLLLFCAFVDMVEQKEEQKLIREKVGKKTYKRIHEEFDDDNDFTRIQKLQNTAQRFNYSANELDSLMEETMELFKCDGKFLQIEQNMHRQLKRLLK